MDLPSGTMIGPYEVKSLLGKGGMGEVYRCRDTRLGRDVAVKLLAPFLVGQPEVEQRLEQEARAVGQLQHPNILAVFDLGRFQDRPYLVTELLLGESLRDLLNRGPLPLRKALGLAQGIAAGLAAAHGKGVIHRDIKPENVFVTSAGPVKILDFGLAKQTLPADHQTGSFLLPNPTEPGMVLGTVAYMSPEQAEGLPLDSRSDVFAFGTLLYEMVSGQRPFPGPSSLDMMYAIAKLPHLPLEEVAPAVPGEVAKLVERCLAKDPANRFQSMGDLALTLELLAGSGAGLRSPATPFQALPATPAAPRIPSRRLGLALGALLMVVTGFAAAWLWPRNPLAPVFRQVTFRRGTVYTARFAPDRQTLVYSAEWDGGRRELFTNVPGSLESRTLGLRGSDVAFLYGSGEAAIIRRTNPMLGSPGVLARFPLAGGIPKDLQEGVSWADGSPDGAQLMVVRVSGGKHVLEYPVGKVIYESYRVISYPRFSPSHRLIAFQESQNSFDTSGCLMVLDHSGKVVTRTPEFGCIEGLAWRSEGEIWFTAVEKGMAMSVRAMDLGGRVREICRVPGRLVLHDVAPDGKVLAERNTFRGSILGVSEGEAQERELAWLDHSRLTALSEDGKWVLFSESGDGTGAKPTAFMRAMDGSAPIRLGEGWPIGLTRSGDHAFVVTLGEKPALELVPVGAGHTRTLSRGPVESWTWAGLVSDRQVVFAGREPGKESRFYLQDLERGDPKPIGPEGILPHVAVLSPDRKQVAAQVKGQLALIALEDGRVTPLEGLPTGALPAGWSRDGTSLYVRAPERMTARLLCYSLQSRKATPWKTLLPPDPAGLIGVGWVGVAGNGAVLVYQGWRLLSDLYVIEGLK